MANYVHTIITFTPSEKFIAGFNRLKSEIESCIDNEDEFCNSIIDFDYEPVIENNEITIFLESKWEAPYQELIELTQDYNVNAKFVFADEYGYDPDKYFDSLDYELEEYDDGIYLSDIQCGMNAACIVKVNVDEDVDNNYYITTYIPKDKDEYNLFYLVAWQVSADNKKYLEQFDFMTTDEFSDGTTTSYNTSINGFYNWLENK